MREATKVPATNDPGDASALPAQPAPVRHLRDLSPQQWKSGVAAWLGWTFDGLDMHLYTLVALIDWFLPEVRHEDDLVHEPAD